MNCLALPPRNITFVVLIIALATHVAGRGAGLPLDVLPPVARSGPVYSLLFQSSLTPLQTSQRYCRDANIFKNSKLNHGGDESNISGRGGVPGIPGGEVGRASGLVSASGRRVGSLTGRRHAWASLSSASMHVMTEGSSTSPEHITLARSSRTVTRSTCDGVAAGEQGLLRDTTGGPTLRWARGPMPAVWGQQPFSPPPPTAGGSARPPWWTPPHLVAWGAAGRRDCGTGRA